MEKSAIIHKSDSIYSFPLNKNSVEIRLLTKKGDNIKKVELVYNDKYKFHEFVNFKEILEFTRTNKDKVILLYGNHCQFYLNK